MVRRCLLVVLLAAMLSSGTFAQSLARPGWQGSGITVENWWQSAILYQIDPLTSQNPGGLGGIIQHLDYLQSLGVDALVLSPFPLEAAGSPRPAAASATLPFDAAYGTEDDLAALVQEASRRHMRVLVDLPFNSTLSDDDTTAAARFWLSRGIAGLRLTQVGQQSVPLTAAQTSSRFAALARLCNDYPGQRILFWDLPEPLDARMASLRVSRRRRRTASTPEAEPGKSLSPAPQLILDDRLLQLNRWHADELRELLKDRSHTAFPLATPVLAADASNRPRSFDRFSDGTHLIELARQTAALLLLGKAVPELYAGQETASVAPTSSVPASEDSQDSLLNWYRRLSSLRHANSALRGGSLDLLSLTNPDLVAWVRRPPSAAADASPIVIVCNVSPHAANISLAAALRALHIPIGTGMLRTLASSVPAADLSNPVPLSALALPAYGVYVGEFRLQPGLESIPKPVRRRSGHLSHSRRHVRGEVHREEPHSVAPGTDGADEGED